MKTVTFCLDYISRTITWVQGLNYIDGYAAQPRQNLNSAINIKSNINPQTLIDQ